MGSKTNWPAVSAIAAISGVFVAFLAYAAPHRTAAGPPTMSLPTTAPAPQPPGQFTPTTVVTPAAPVQVPTTTPGPPLSVAPLQPARCAKARSGVDTYYQTAGTTRYTQLAAAREAAQDMWNVATGLRGDGPFSAISALYNDFVTLKTILEGHSSQDYTAAQAQTSADAQTLRRVCDTS